MRESRKIQNIWRCYVRSYNKLLCLDESFWKTNRQEKTVHYDYTYRSSHFLCRNSRKASYVVISSIQIKSILDSFH